MQTVGKEFAFLGAAGVEKQGEYATIHDKNMAVSPLKFEGTLRGPTMQNDALRCKTTSNEKFAKLHNQGGIATILHEKVRYYTHWRMLITRRL